jgi:hypothetical protein
MKANEHPQRRSTAAYWVGFLVLLGVAVFFLWTEHRAHLLGVLPYALFLLCPAMHYFMHRGHRHE